VLRSLVLDAAAALDIPLSVTTLSAAQLRTAPAIYCSNVRWGLRRAGSLDGRPLGADARAARLMGWIDAQP
jgi:branched-subunit amino acid aminotransferase/4-amino-4-deoxychorismate lyase